MQALVGALIIQMQDSKTPVPSSTILGCSLGTLAPSPKPCPCPGKPCCAWASDPPQLGRWTRGGAPAFLPHCPMGFWEEAKSGKIVNKEEQ